MRLTLFMGLCLAVSVATVDDLWSQGKNETRITLSLTDVSVNKVFEMLYQQTGYRFFYDESYLSQLTVSVQMKNASLQQVLSHISAQTGLKFRKEDDTYTVIRLSSPQNDNSSASTVRQTNSVTGTVTDANGESLPGVNVVIKGSTAGVVTNVSGQFSINVPDKEAVLVFSSVGFATQEVMVGDRTSIEVSLSESAQEIEEVVVVAYGVQKKVSVTGAVSHRCRRKT